MWNSERTDYKDEVVPFSARLQDSSLSIRFDGAILRKEIRVPFEVGAEIPDLILSALGESTTEELKDEILMLKARIEELEEENYYKHQERYDDEPDLF